MAKLVSMKMSAAEQKKNMEPAIAEKDRPRYPWGLTLNLETEALKKLGIGKELPAIGESYLLIAKVDVISAASNESEGGSRRSLGLQITEMCFEDPDTNKDSAASTLYEPK